MMETPQPLFSKDAEENLLGSLLINPNVYHELDISAADFYVSRHRMIYSAFEAITRRGIDPDMVTLADELDKSGQLAEVGGPSYLAKIVSITGSSLYADNYAEVVRDLSKRRGLIALAGEIAKAAFDRKVDIATKAPEFMDALAHAGQMADGAVHWSKYLDELWAEIQARAAAPQDYWGLPTGFKDFDQITGGLQNGELLIMSGKPGVGKTMLATQMCTQMAAKGAPGAIYSLEMNGKAVARRQVSAQSGIPTRPLKTGRVQEKDWTPLTNAFDSLNNLPVYMSDATGWTTTALRADLTRLKATGGIKWFMFDYLMLANDACELSANERTAMISRNFKLLCRHLDMPGILIHSMNKEGMRAAAPDQASLTQSAQIVYDADLIIFLTEFQAVEDRDNFIPKKDQDNLITVIFGKGRELENPKRAFYLVRRPGFPAFGDYAGNGR